MKGAWATVFLLQGVALAGCIGGAGCEPASVSDLPEGSWTVSAGCVSDSLATTPWQPLECDASGARRASVPAPLVGFEDVNDTVEALARALGHEVRPDTVQRQETRWTWQLRDGGNAIFFPSHGASRPELRIPLPGGWAEGDATAAREVLARLAAALRLPNQVGVRGLDEPMPRLVQVVNGQDVAELVRLQGIASVQPAFDLPAQVPLLEADSAVDAVIAYIGCEHNPAKLELANPPTLDVRGHRLLWAHKYTNPVSNKYLQHFHVYVDAATGAILDGEFMAIVC